ncbi:MAG: HAD hydrolase-like protein, partial [Nocardioidaceae bacterium]
VIARTTGRHPQVAGKPQPPLFEETLLRVGGERPLVVGDRLDTDIEGAVRWGADSLLVMTGVTDVPTLAAAAQGRRPTYVSCDLAGLFVPHPLPSVERSAARCGGWTARGTQVGGATRAELAGSGPAEDALRALVSLCWAHRDAHDEPISASAVDTAWRRAVGSV